MQQKVDIHWGVVGGGGKRCPNVRQKSWETPGMKRFISQERVLRYVKADKL